MEDEYRDRVNFVPLNVESSKWAQEVEEYGVKGIPMVRGCQAAAVAAGEQKAEQQQGSAGCGAALSWKVHVPSS